MRRPHILLREYFILILVGLLAACAILSSLITSYKAYQFVKIAEKAIKK